MRPVKNFVSVLKQNFEVSGQAYIELSVLPSVGGGRGEGGTKLFPLLTPLGELAWNGQT